MCTNFRNDSIRCKKKKNNPKSSASIKSTINVLQSKTLSGMTWGKQQLREFTSGVCEIQTLDSFSEKVPWLQTAARVSLNCLQQECGEISANMTEKHCRNKQAFNQSLLYIKHRSCGHNIINITMNSHKT